MSMDVRTDVELALFLRCQTPVQLERFAAVCDQMAREREGGSEHGLEIFAGAARAVLRGEDPVAFQRLAAGIDRDYYKNNNDGGRG